VWEHSGNDFERMSNVVWKSVMNGGGRAVQLLLAMNWPERMTDGGGNNAGLHRPMLCDHFCNTPCL
jgi:hypothetical protein